MKWCLIWTTPKSGAPEEPLCDEVVVRQHQGGVPGALPRARIMRVRARLRSIDFHRGTHHAIRDLP